MTLRLLDRLSTMGVRLVLRNGGPYALDRSALTPEARALVAEHREAIVAELSERDAGWWNAPGWTVAGWLAEVADAGVTVEWSDRCVTLRSRSGYVPPWVCGDRHQLQAAGVLAAHFAARDGAQTAPDRRGAAGNAPEASEAAAGALW